MEAGGTMQISELETKKKEYEQMKVKLENTVSMLVKAKETNSNVAREIVANYISQTANKKAEEIEENSILIEQIITRIKNMILDVTDKIQLLKIQIEEARIKLNSAGLM